MKNLFFLIALVSAARLFSAVDLVNMPVNTWVQIPNTPLNSVAPSGWSANVIDAWSGAALDTKLNRLIVWGGGHNDYSGNEIYAYEIDNEKWVRLTNPTVNSATCSDNNSDGTPVSRHTYNGLAYIASADRFFGIGGALSCNQGGCGANKTWTFNFANSTWQNMNPTGTIPPTCCGDVCTYDPATGKVYFGDSGAWACGNSNTTGFFSYDYSANKWTRLSGDFFLGGMAVDTKRHVLLNTGHTSGYSNDYVTAFDLNTITPARQVWNTTGGDAFIQGNPTGLAYDSAADKYVGWSGGAVNILDPVTKIWTSKNPAGGPPGNVFGVTNGVYGRWQYVPKVNAFIAVVGISLNVYFYKLTAGLGTGASTEGSAQAAAIPVASVLPNPFRSFTALHFSPGSAPNRVVIYNLFGRRVAELPVRWNQAVFEGKDAQGRILTPGVYTALFRTGKRTNSVKLFLMN